MAKSDFEQLCDIFPVSHETFERLLVYKNLILKWQKSVNLVAPSTIAELWQRHFLDSIQIAKYIPTSGSVILDIGSGAGFPGMVLAIATGNEFHLVESDNKKSIFLREVSRETSTQVIIHNDRIENLSIYPNIIVSRACSDVSQLLDWSTKIVSHETKCLFHKSKNYSMELDDAKNKWQFDYIIHPSVTETESIILELSSIQRRIP